MNTERVRADFDEIAQRAEAGESGTDRYDAFLASQVPPTAQDILDVGCGLGRLTSALARGDRRVVGIDLSPLMIEGARRSAPSGGPSYVCGDFMQEELGESRFDCIVSAATLHHMPEDLAIGRMVHLLKPGGRLIIQDLRRDVGIADIVRSHCALIHVVCARFLRTGRLLPHRSVRRAWDRHGAAETYLSPGEAQQMADRLLPGARVSYHWLWRYTIVWDKP